MRDSISSADGLNCERHRETPTNAVYTTRRTARKNRTSPRTLAIAARQSDTRSMPLQNRVTPFGDIVAIPQRGMFMGNRGIIHDPATKTLLRKRWSNKAWIICTCSYKNHHREVMATQSWTELFFLDEAVALAAGHRPCFACRRDPAEAFRLAWSNATNAESVRTRDGRSSASGATSRRSQTHSSSRHANRRAPRRRRHRYRWRRIHRRARFGFPLD